MFGTKERNYTVYNTHFERYLNYQSMSCIPRANVLNPLCLLFSKCKNLFSYFLFNRFKSRFDFNCNKKEQKLADNQITRAW